ncbi:MAG TPA: CPBP family intramembrane glutamic endopeptidase [Polyangiaceae bacterium]|nr:CPBP family intramembrane glutamic endopeptidase [Polyangiaceae bacterium]
MFRWGRASVAYALIAAGAIALGHGFDRTSLISYPGSWLPLSGLEAHTFSLVLGGAFAVLVVLGTRVLVENVGWARNLHRDLRPMTLRLDGAGILAIATLSALAEELVFRGLLLPWVGLLPQALLFGVAHAQLSGPSRWVWVAWASVVGLALGAMFQLTGSLLGPMLAHGLINGLNLLYLKSHDTSPPRNSLGGLLSDRRSSVPERPSPLPAGRRA